MTTPSPTTVPITSAAWEARISDDPYKLTITEITNDEEYQVVAAELVRIAEFRRDLKENRKDLTRGIDDSKKKIMAQERAFDAPYAQAENTLRLMGRDWRAKVAREAARAQAELDRIAKAAAEKEALERAEELEAAGKPEEAEAAIAPEVVEQAVQRRTMHISTAPPKAEGIAVTTTWKYRIVDQNKIPKQWWVLDDQAIAKHGRDLKERAEIPGVEFYPDEKERVG